MYMYMTHWHTHTRYNKFTNMGVDLILMGYNTYQQVETIFMTENNIIVYDRHYEMYELRFAGMIKWIVVWIHNYCTH